MVDHAILLNGLNEGQRFVYRSIIDSIRCGVGGFFFVYGSGGTGKTYLWRTLLACLSSEGKITLAVASSGIVALLLDGGMTAHSRLKIPVTLEKDSILNVNKSSPLAQLLCRASLLNEAPMTHCFAFEAMDRSFHDLMCMVDPDARTRAFGGKTIVLGGDFRQILPVIPQGTRGDVVAATVCSSYLWADCRVLTLTENMRLRDVRPSELAWFSNWLLQLGEGLLPLKTFNEDEKDPTWLELPDMFLFPFTGDPIYAVVTSTYPDLLQRISDSDYLRERVILAPKNEVVDKVNDHLIEQLSGDIVTYLSADRISRSSENYEAQVDLYHVEYLNSSNFSGVPNHKLILKIGVPIILLRNLNQTIGLCNGTRLIVTKLASKVVEAEIIAGSNIGSRCLIRRVEMVPSDTHLPFLLSQRQFSVKVCFAMSINKSHGQTFKHVGLYLPTPAFSHGQLYVVASRVSSSKGFRVFLKNDDVNKIGHTKNIVYTEVFEHLRNN